MRTCPWSAHMQCSSPRNMSTRRSGLRGPGVRAELVLGAAQRGASATAGPAGNAFLRQRLSYDGERLLDEQQRGVMMAWEGGAPSA